MNINPLTGINMPSYISESSKKKANKDQWDAIVENQHQESTKNRDQLSLDQLEANSNAARARVQNAEQTNDISTLPLGERLELLRQEGRQVDRNNMTDKEIFEEIFTRFDKYLNGEPEWPFISLGYDFPGKNDISAAYTAEIMPLIEAGWSDERIMNGYAEGMGYGGMTPNEMKKAITEKYASQGPMTPYRFNSMLKELSFTGAMEPTAARSIALSMHFSVAMHVDNHYLNSGIEYNVLRDENYYERTKDMYRELYNAPIGFTGIRDDLIYRMTDGGGRSAETERAIYDFLEFLAGMNLL